MAVAARQRREEKVCSANKNLFMKENMKTWMMGDGMKFGHLG